MGCKIPIDKRKPPGTAFGFPLPDGPGVVLFVHWVGLHSAARDQDQDDHTPAPAGSEPGRSGVVGQAARAVQAEHAPKTVVVAVRGRVPVAIRRAAVDWIVVPATPTQDAIMILLHYGQRSEVLPGILLGISNFLRFA